MAIRITQNSLASTFQSDVQSIYAKMSKSLQQSTDGKKITRSSDDPYGTSQILGFDTQLAETKRFQANVSDSMGFMDAADSALDTVTVALQQIQNKTRQANNGTNSPADLQSISTEILQLKEVVREAMNAQHGGQYIFGGTASTTVPFPAGSNLYGGTANTMSRRIGPGQSIAINTPGDSVLGPNGGNVLDAIDTLAADVAAGNGVGMTASLASMQTSIDTVLDQRTRLGAASARLEVTQERLDLSEQRLIEARSEVADVDATEAYMDYTQQQTMYQAALAAGTRMMQTSILDFI